MSIGEHNPGNSSETPVEERQLKSNYLLSELHKPQVHHGSHAILNGGPASVGPSLMDEWKSKGYEVVLVDPIGSESFTAEELKAGGMVGVVLRAAQQ